MVAAVTTERGCANTWVLSYQPEEAKVKLGIARCSQIVHELPCYNLNTSIWWDTACIALKLREGKHVLRDKVHGCHQVMVQRVLLGTARVAAYHMTEQLLL